MENVEIALYAHVDADLLRFKGRIYSAFWIDPNAARTIESLSQPVAQLSRKAKTSRN